MARTKTSINAVEILRKRYIQGDTEREKSVDSECLNAEIARMIYELRRGAGLNQKDLAELIGTTQSVISRLEDSDYEGHSLPMLERIAKALNKRVTVAINEPQVREETAHYAFRRFVQIARRERGLSLGEASKKLAIDVTEFEQIENDCSCKPTPLTLNKLGKFYGVSVERLGALAGEPNKVSSEAKKRAAKFVAQSESIAKLTREEKEALNQFMRYLKNG